MKIPQTIIDDILSLDISEVIGNYIQLTKKGVNYQSCCPFHSENTPSFSVSSSKGIYKCFGCGKSGNSIGFVMDHLKLEYPAAIREIASKFNITILKYEFTEEESKEYKKKEQLFFVNKMASDWFIENLKKPEYKSALEYVQGRWSEEMIRDFGIGFAPDSWDSFRKWSQETGMRDEILIEAGLLSESKGKVFDSFRNRIMFPIHSKTGRITGFTGRDFSASKDAPKYLNTKETVIFNKSKILYGLNTAYRSIKEKSFVILVEGNPDVIRLQEIGKLNTVGTCGTSLTRDHIEELKKLCGSVTIIGDGDDPGQKAVLRSGKMILEAGMFCNVIPLPLSEKKEDKEDPDSYFKTDKGIDFDEYAKKHIVDFIIHSALIRKDKAKNPDLKSKLIDEISGLITNLPTSSHQLYIEQLSGIIKPKKCWQDKIKSLLSEEPVEEEGFRIPKHVSLSDFQKYGFYDEKNCYWFKTNQDPKRGSNFVLEPLFHIHSIMNAKRLFKITNEFNYSQVIELDQRDLVSLSSFRLRIESIGNFLFEGSELELNRLKRFLYEKTLSAFIITQLGWHNKGFWAWCSGIDNGKFTETDANGIVSHNDDYFYLPSSSDIYKGEDGLFVSERQHRYNEGTISLYDYAVKLINVFGENSIFGLCFYFASLYRDYITRLFGFFPILNLFGPKGAGKTEMAIALLQFFGPHVKGPNLTNTTRAALADHIALLSNGFCHIDEYKNSIEFEKIEFLKGLWDGTGRTRMNMDKDKKKETTKVDCGVIVSGQEMPTADIALYTRLIFLSFNKVEYSKEEKLALIELQDIGKAGVCQITHELLQHRKFFIANYLDTYKQTSDDLTAHLGKDPVEDRIFRNWLVIIASYRTLSSLIKVPWSDEDLIKKSVKLIRRQNSETKKNNELSTFWSIVEFLVNDGLIKQEIDFKIKTVNKLKTDLINEADWKESKTILIINHSRIFEFYRKHGKSTDAKILPLSTLDYYLKNCKEYMGKKESVNFRVQKDGRMVEDTEDIGSGKKICKRRNTTAMVFDYVALNISIHMKNKNDDDDDDNDLPF